MKAGRDHAHEPIDGCARNHFNAGSALEANGSAALAFMNTYLATACAVLSWIAGEWIVKGKPSMLGAASGAVAGLVAITPAAGNVGISGAFAIGLGVGVVCLWGVTGLKRLIKADDSLDVFGVHAIGGIFGALMTGIFNAPSLGGPGSRSTGSRARAATPASGSNSPFSWRRCAWYSRGLRSWPSSPSKS